MAPGQPARTCLTLSFRGLDGYHAQAPEGSRLEGLLGPAPNGEESMGGIGPIYGQFNGYPEFMGHYDRHLQLHI